MTTTLTMEIGDIVFRVDVPSPAWLSPLLARYAPFLKGGPRRRRDAETRRQDESPCHRVTASPCHRVTLSPWPSCSSAPAEPAWHVALTHDPSLEDTDSPWIRHDGPVTRFRVAAYAGWMDLASREATVSAPSVARAIFAVERLLIYICMQMLPREHAALLLHAAGIVFAGEGYAFFGASGAGKSTVARLAAGHGEVLTDENVIVRPGPEGPELLSTPFWGHSTPPEMIRCVNRRVPLRALYMLVQAQEFDLTLLSPGQAVMALLTTEKVATERIASAVAWLAVVERLVEQVPVYQLAFRPTVELWDFLF